MITIVYHSNSLLDTQVSVTVVSWDTDFTQMIDQYDALFISNGPGNPEYCSLLIQRLSNIIRLLSLNFSTCDVLCKSTTICYLKICTSCHFLFVRFSLAGGL